MNKCFLIEELSNIKNATRENRLKVANIVLNNETLFPLLLEIVFEINHKISIKAAWVLEFVCAENLNLLTPYLTYFTNNINTVKYDSAVRPISKICEFLAKAYTSKNATIIKYKITDKQIETIIETGFDWLIGSQKVAVKAYTMEMLFLFGKNKNWVHTELQLIIQQNIVKESAAYKARGKKILKSINQK
jgi:hypothetical protein